MQAGNVGVTRTVIILIGKYEVRRPFGRSKHRWEYNTKIYLRYIVCGNGDLILRSQELYQ